MDFVQLSSKLVNWFRQCEFEQQALTVCKQFIWQYVHKEKTGYPVVVQNYLEHFEPDDFDIIPAFNYLTWYPQTHSSSVGLFFESANFADDFTNPYNFLQRICYQGITYIECTNIHQQAQIHFVEQNNKHQRLLLIDTDRIAQCSSFVAMFEKACKELEIVPKTRASIVEYLESLDSMGQYDFPNAQEYRPKDVRLELSDIRLGFMEEYTLVQDLLIGWNLQFYSQQTQQYETFERYELTGTPDAF